MFKFLKNDNKKKSFDDGGSESDERCSLDYAEKLICDNEDLDSIPQPAVKLHRSLNEILNDRTTLSLFVQYLESKHGLHLVKFWLDIEAFKAVQKGNTPSMRLESRSSNYETGKFRLKRSVSTDEAFRETETDSISTASCSESNIDETEETQSNAGDEVDHSKTYDSLERMTQSLTDDEKSKICEKNRKEVEVDSKSSTSSRKLQPTVHEDALRIYRKYLVTDSAYSVELPATILSKLSLALCETETSRDCDSNELWEAFEEAQRFVFDLMEKENLAEFLESSFYNSYTVEVLTSESLSLREILFSESALFYFMEFLEQDKDSKLPYLEFWLSATNFQKQFEQNLEETRSDALVIYEKWFSLQATTPLNFSNRIRTKVEESICSSDLSFDLPIRIVETFLERNCFKNFIKSQLFFKHLSEVMSKIDGNDKSNSNGIIRRNSSLSIKFPTKIRHRRTNSDAKGLTRSISTQNTLLAGLEHKKNKNSAFMNIDSRQLADPDLLWRRKNSDNGLSFGRVDAFGRYERDFDLPSATSSSIPSSKSMFQIQSATLDDPQALLDLNSTQNRFKNVMRKLVHLNDDSLQQEIAWQVAEMIVKDVTSITLSNGNLG